MSVPWVNGECPACGGRAPCEADEPAILLAAGMFAGASEADLDATIARAPEATMAAPDWVAAATRGYQQGRKDAEDTIASLRGGFRVAAKWIADVQLHYCLGPEASPEDIFMVAREEHEVEIARWRAVLKGANAEIGRCRAALNGLVVGPESRERAERYECGAPLPEDTGDVAATDRLLLIETIDRATLAMVTDPEIKPDRRRSPQGGSDYDEWLRTRRAAALAHRYPWEQAAPNEGATLK